MKKKLGMLFPGYGSQYVGMCKELYDASRLVQEYFEEASICLDNNLIKVCFASSDAEIGKMQYAFPLIFVGSASIVSLLKSEGIQPDVVAGYNTGEFAAAFAAGGLNFHDGLYLLNKYALAYQELMPEIGDVALMRVIGLETAQLSAVCESVAQELASTVPIVLYQRETEHLIAGFVHAVEAVCARLSAENKKAKAKAVGLEVGLHCALMKSVVTRLLMYLEKVDFHDTSIPLICNTSASAIQTGEQLREQLIGSINHPLLWTQVLEQFADCDIIIEVGPGVSLQSQLQERYPDKVIRTVNKPEDVAALKSLLLTDEEQMPNTETNDGNV